MGEPTAQARVLKFGTFELDAAAGELRKNGRKVPLPSQPFQLLTALAERPGEVVTRDDLKETLWPGDTYIDFDRSLNTAASKVREALGDSASSPRFVETLPRRGYRFLASVEGLPAETSGEVAETPLDGDHSVGDARRTLTRERLTWLIATTCLVGMTVVGSLYFSQAQPETPRPPYRRFGLSGEFAVLYPHQDSNEVAISPNGRYIAFIGGYANGLWIHDFELGESRPIDGTAQVFRPFWSPDSSFVGFDSHGELQKVSVQGGPPIRICGLPGDLPLDHFHGGAWRPDLSSIVFSAGVNWGPHRIYEVPARGGAPASLIAPEDLGGLLEEPVQELQWPRFLTSRTGDLALLFVAWQSGTETWAGTDTLVLQNLATGQRKVLAPGTKPFYSPSGHILYQPTWLTNEVWALPFSLDTLEVTGDAFLVAQGAQDPSVADDQTLVYFSSAPESRKQQLVWVDRSGVVVGEIGQPQEFMRHPSLSPDERFVAVSTMENSGRSIWVWDIVRDVKTNLGGASSSAWAPTGKELVFTSGYPEGSEITIRRADASGGTQLLAAKPDGGFVNDWSVDGKYVIYDRGPSPAAKDLWYLERKGGSDDWEPHSFLETPSNEFAAQLSPDARFVAYVSNESGRNEVYVRPFPKGEGKITISNDGGVQPCWSQNGKELFYSDGSTLISVPVSTDGSFSVGAPERLFSHPAMQTGNRFRQYDVSADGQRFILPQRVEEDDVRAEIQVVQNWYEEFRDREQD